jgi:hypothetical protein
MTTKNVATRSEAGWREDGKRREKRIQRKNEHREHGEKA